MIMAQEETTATKRQKKFITSIETLTSGTMSIPTLPFDLVAEILCRLPLNLLLQLRYLCKSFNSLISDPKFAKKHLRMSTARHHLIIGSRNINLGKLCLLDSPLPSVFSTSRVTLKQTELNYYPVSLNNGYQLKVCSCDGILCISTNSPYERSAILWNPSFRNFKILPPLEFEWEHNPAPIYSFGYDHFIDSYKIIVVSNCSSKKGKIEVGVHSLSTNYWRRIHDIPFSGWIQESGIFVSGTINWLVFDISNIRLSAIVSLDLVKESYKMLKQPDLKGINAWKKSLGMLTDCLCIFDSSDNMFFDVWIMKEYGNRESWTKLYRLPPMRNHVIPYTKVLYMSEDDQILVNYKDSGVVVYDYKNSTLNIPEFESKNLLMDPNVYIESLISP